eukprot:TRINITY_DN9766_c1_g1_i1.p1 TRINITY_DN9766_c1_g1~~TRINITY_DN9766_c1_g1_i1.p1  ORF type:complete len:273 (+),score=83.11 TRINITY_DN9766_c1_g1_i1:68-820(+)
MSRPAKKVKKSSFRSDETDKVLSMHKEKLAEKMQAFLDSLSPLTSRYYEISSKVNKSNPNSVPSSGGSEPSTPSHKASKKEKRSFAEANQKKELKEAKDLPQLPDNSDLLNQLSILKQEANELGKSLNAIAEWIALMVPAIKEEDNAGVEVQMQVHSELMGLTKEVEGKYELESDYLEGRANMESKYYKHFLAPSWYKVIEKHDQNRWDDLELAWKELVRITLTGYTLLTNNMEKLKNPRSGSLASFMTM